MKNKDITITFGVPKDQVNYILTIIDNYLNLHQYNCGYTCTDNDNGNYSNIFIKIYAKNEYDPDYIQTRLKYLIWAVMHY